MLGKVGRKRYRELAEEEWSMVPAREPGTERGSSTRSCAITRIMEALARDADELVAVMSRDLASGHQFLRIASAMRAAGRDEDAFAWAGRGMAAFPESPDSRLVEFLADEHARRGEHTDATRLAWGQYERLPRLDTYQKLKQHAEPAGQWDERRPRALKLLRAHLKRESAKQAASPYRAWHRADRSGLVRIFLWEGDIDAAWTEAKDGGCSPELWLELAERRRAHHPEDALDVYQAQVEPTIERKNNDAYQQAATRARRERWLGYDWGCL